MSSANSVEEYLPYTNDDLTSIYIHDYTGRQGDRSKPYKRTGEKLPDAPFDGTSTSKVDYQAWPRVKTQSCKPAAKPAVSDAAFDPNTTHSLSYTGQRGEMRQPYRPSTSLAQDAPFDASTTTREDYKRYDQTERVKPIKPASTVVENLPFNASSTHANDFRQHGNAVRRPFKPQNNPASLSEDRDFLSETRSNFAGTRGVPSTSCKPNARAEQGPDTRDFLTETQGNFDNKGFCATKPIRPSSQPIPAHAFDATTTTRTDFPGWNGVGPAQSCKPANQRNAVPENRDFLTETRGSFVPQNGERAALRRPPNGYNPGDDNRDFTTEMKDNMRNFGKGDRMPIVKPVPTVVENIPFNGTSTHAMDFRQHPTAVRRPFKPNTTATSLSEDRDFTSETRSNFAGTRGAPSMSCKPNTKAELGPDNRDFLTETKGNFDNKGFCATKPIRPSSQPIPAHMFDGTTTTRTDFPRWSGADPAQSCKPANQRNAVPENRDFLTETRGSFIPQKGERAELRRPPNGYNPGDDNRDFTTEMKDNMRNFGKGDRMPIVKPVPTVVENIPFNGTSTHAMDFRKHGNAVRRPFKPQNNPASLSEDRDFLSETRSNFAGTRGVPSTSCKPDARAEQGPDNRDFLTETKGNFDNKGFCATKPIRPPSQPIPAHMFDGVTTTRTDFPVWSGAGPAQSCKPANQRNAVPENRDFLTETRGSFVPQNGERAALRRPPNGYNPGDDNRDFTTEMKDNMRNFGKGDRMPIVKPVPTVVDNVPFNATSTHAMDFKPHDGATRRPFRPNNTANMLGEDRDFKTEFRSNYIPYREDKYAESLNRPDNRPKPSFRYIR